MPSEVRRCATRDAEDAAVEVARFVVDCAATISRAGKHCSGHRLGKNPRAHWWVNQGQLAHMEVIKIKSPPQARHCRQCYC
eukprot:6165109-Amphidinium_carterae.1